MRQLIRLVTTWVYYQMALPQGVLFPLVVSPGEQTSKSGLVG